MSLGLGLREMGDIERGISFRIWRLTGRKIGSSGDTRGVHSPLSEAAMANMGIPGCPADDNGGMRWGRGQERASQKKISVLRPLEPHVTW